MKYRFLSSSHAAFMMLTQVDFTPVGSDIHLHSDIDLAKKNCPVMGGGVDGRWEIRILLLHLSIITSVDV